MPVSRKPIIANVERLHRLMDRDGLDAVVARSGVNFTYLSGFAYPGTLARHLDLPDSPRGVFAIWPRHGDPAIVLNAVAKQLTERDSWISRVEVYAGYEESPLDRLAAVLKSMGLSEARLGIEKTYVNALDWEKLTRALPEARLIDCTRTMDEVRWVKTAGEIKLLETGADLLDEAFREVFPTVADGESERAVHSRLIASCLRRGADWAHGILNSSRNTVPYGGESDHPFVKGDVIRTDYVAYVDGYPGHQSRVAIMGRPSAEQAAAYRRMHDIYRASCDRLRPGATAGDVYRFVVERFADAGIAYTSMLAGHGVGCWWHQQEPVISRGNPIVLEEGMTIAMEPHVDHWHIQDMFLVTRDGPKLLSRLMPTDDPYIVRLD